MYNLITIIYYVILAEILRRCYLALIVAFTGPLSKIPGPFINKLTPIPWIIKVLTGTYSNVAPDLFKKYGDIVRVGPRDVIVSDKNAIQKIIVEKDFRKSRDFEFAREDKEIASIFTETDKGAHKQRRRLLSPGFSISYLNGLEPFMQECLDALVRVLDAKSKDGGEQTIVDINNIMGNLTFDVMSAASFGGSFNLVGSDNSEQKEMFNAYLKRVAFDAILPFIKYLPFVPPSSSGRITEQIHEIVSKRRKEMKSGLTRKDILQILIDMNDADPVSFSEKHLREEMITFMIAGSDTTSLTATFTLLLLLNNQEKLKKLTDEIDKAFVEKEDKITFAKTQDLPYLNAVINESMRVMPIITGGLVRLTTENVVLCGYEIPEETTLTAFLSVLQRDPRSWPDADSFVPERWLGDYKGVAADRKAFLPFSAGSRLCIGQQFALKELRLILATLVRRYDLSLVKGQSHELRTYIVPYFKQGFYKVGLKLRS